jgi:hypothetical protein
MERRLSKHTGSLEERLADRAKLLREEATLLPPGLGAGLRDPRSSGG